MSRSSWVICHLPLIEGRHDGRRILLPVAVLASRDPFDLTHFVYQGLLDTGATSSWITPKVISDLSLRELGKETVSVATEERTASVYLFRIGLFGEKSVETSIPFVFPDITGFQLSQHQGFDVLIGMDVIRQCHLIVSRSGDWSLAFG